MAATLLHLSVAAADPRRAAELLAELSGGTVEPFTAPGLTGAFVCLWPNGQLVEFVPRGVHLRPGGRFSVGASPGPNSTHFQLRVPQTTLAQVQTLARTSGCELRFRGPSRGGPLQELWLEPELMVELVLDPETTPRA